jgi:hypothetical protein
MIDALSPSNFIATNPEVLENIISSQGQSIQNGIERAKTHIVTFGVKPIDINEPKIIKDGLKQYYLIDNKLYKVKKDKTQGDLFGSYKDGKIIEGVEEIENIIIIKGTKSKSTNNEVNIIENDNEILTVSKKKISKSKIGLPQNIIDDNEIDNIINAVSKKKTSKSKINIISDNVILEEEPEIKVKKIIKKKVKNNTDIEL